MALGCFPPSSTWSSGLPWSRKCHVESHTHPMLSEPGLLVNPSDDKCFVPLLVAVHQPFPESCSALNPPVLKHASQQTPHSWCLNGPQAILLIFSSSSDAFLPLRVTLRNHSYQGGVVRRWLCGSLVVLQQSLAPKWMLKGVHGNDVHGSAFAETLPCCSYSISQVLNIQ